jgi:hypothetical protein
MKFAKNNFIHKTKRNIPWAIIVVICVLLVVLGLCIFSFKQYIDANKDPNAFREKQEIGNAKDVAKEVGQHFDLPANETPSVATITKIDTLKNEPFFVNAEVGDQILVYKDAKLVILYRPKTKVVIKSGPLIESASSLQPTQ